jgi:hypothetical protein
MDQIEQMLEGAAAQAAKDRQSNGDRERSMDDVSRSETAEHCIASRRP